MKCCGNIDGTPCNHRFEVDPTDPTHLHKLAALHLDHDYELDDVCAAWQQAMPANLKSWDDGVHGEFLCHLMFSVEDHANSTEDKKWKAAVHFRCGTSLTRRKGDFCHDYRYTHPDHQIASEDLKK